MGSARGNSPILSLHPTHVTFDRSLETSISFDAKAAKANAQAAAPARLSPTTYVTSDRVRKAMEKHHRATPNIAVERAHRHLRPPRVKRWTGPNHRNATCDTRVTLPLMQARAAIAGPSVLRRCEIADLPEGTYFTVALHLNARALCEVDATCRTLRGLNQLRFGPWHTIGARSFRGIELEKAGIFDVTELPKSEMPFVLKGQDTCRRGGTSDMRSDFCGVRKTPPPCSKHTSVDWKRRYWHFQQKLPTFQLPFIGQEIHQVPNQDQVAYCCCMIRADLLCKSSDFGVYIEFEVVANVDNLSLAVVDFETAANNCVTFSPDTGAVFREKKVQDVPRKVEGAYFHPLASTLPGSRFEGSIGIYFYAGHLAFFRRCASKNGEQRLWESTGFVTDLSWAEGRCLAPCLAFRKEGEYHVKIAAVNSAPPLPLGNVPQTYDEARWHGLHWQAETPEV